MLWGDCRRPTEPAADYGVAAAGALSPPCVPSGAIDPRVRALVLGLGGAVLVIDLVRFKEPNDTLGHVAGDQLLAQLGPRLRRALPGDAVLARLGGDEIAVVLRDADTALYGEAASSSATASHCHRQPIAMNARCPQPGASYPATISAVGASSRSAASPSTPRR